MRAATKATEGRCGAAGEGAAAGDAELPLLSLSSEELPESSELPRVRTGRESVQVRA